MREKSLKKASISFSSETINLLSVCRLKDSAKAIFRMVEVCSILRDRGFEFKWYVIGDGPDRKALEVLIHKSHLEDCMILLGLKENPFPYYRMADVVAMLSYHEGLCGVINEAKVMKKAVVATKVSGVYEQLIDRQTGLIVDQEVSAIVEGLAELISDSELRTRLAESGYPTSILEDEHKITSLEALFDKEQ
nr:MULTISPECIES: glycosyltransferase [unclassified Idiomarina]